MKTGPADDLGHHRRRSRVVWYPGSTPAYSSLWITIQRFLILNQPSRAAFAADFLQEGNAGRREYATHSPSSQPQSECQIEWGHRTVRLKRFTRALNEPVETFRCCHVGQFPDLVRPYFGEFAVCPHCLGEGFHSVLYSFEGLRDCPVHGTTLESPTFLRQLSIELFNTALRTPFGRGQYLQDLLGLPAARTPIAYPQRDLVLGEIAYWLMDVGARCWLGQHGARQAMPLDAFINRLAGLRVALSLPDHPHHRLGANDPLAPDSAFQEIATLGSVKVCKSDLVSINDRRARRHQTDLNLYGKTIFGDFKAIRRFYKRRALNRAGRYWLTRLEQTSSAEEVAALLCQGDEPARRAWLLLAWSRHIIKQEFNPRAGLHTRPIQFAVSGDIPLWVANFGRRQTQSDHDFVHLWIARWISAAGLMAFWRSARSFTNDELSPDRAVLDRMLLETLREPRWGLAISANNELKLCLALSHETLGKSDPAATGSL